MADVNSAVAEMAATVARGETPEALSAFLKAAFPPPRGWWNRWIEGPRTYRVNRIVAFRHGTFFRRSCVFWVHADDHLLEGCPLPSSHSYGLFALGPSGLRYLHRRPDQVAALLHDEKRPLEEADPTALAWLLAETLARQGNNSHDVIGSPDEVARYDGGRRGFGGGYVLDPMEWECVESEVAPPTIERDGQQGWRLRFCALAGWMHAKSSLIRHRFLVRSNFTIEHQQDVLSSAIFSSLPHLVY